MEEGKIYTRKGDKGQTSLLGGKRVPKYHLKIEAYGTIDELNSFIGLLRDQQIDVQRQMLLKIQDRLFVAESLIARDKGGEDIPLPQLYESDVQLLETEIDRMNENLPKLSKFILPGGHPAVSYAHVARCVCRRAERIILKLSEEEKVEEVIIQYFNRLSDYLFVLARAIAKDLGIQENLWLPEKTEE